MTDDQDSKQQQVEDDLDFGDFSAAGGKPVENGHHPQMMEDNDEDPFGDFASPSQEEQQHSDEKETVPDVHSADETAQDNNDDSFGDFGSAPISEDSEPTTNSPQATNPEAEVDMNIIDKPSNASSDNNTNDAEQTNNFSATEDQRGAGHKSDDEKSSDWESISENKKTGTSAPSDDDFGDFDDATEQMKAGNGQVVDVAETMTDNIDKEDDDDDFGDFGSAEPAPPIESQPVNDSNEAKAEGDEDEDEFGDFGDFDSAAVASPAPAPSPAFVTNKSSSEGDGFGDFSTQSPSATKFDADFSVSKSGNADEASDPVLQKARNVLSKVFQQYTAEKIEDNGDSSLEKVSVESLMATVDKDSENDSKESPKEALQAILKDSKIEASASLFIVAEDEGSGPNVHFSVPIEGTEAALGSEGRRNRRNASDSTSSLPEMLPIQLSPAESPKRDTATKSDQSPRNNEPPAAQQPQGTIVQIPPKADGGDQTEQPSEKALQFLEKIPDLSFMLESKLTLPGKQK